MMKIQKIITNMKNSKKGFVLLFSILVSVLVLAVGASIISIALKQVILSGSGRDSQFAFYAANTGAECALYWDLAGDSEGNNVFYAFSTGYGVPVGISCLGLPLALPEDVNQECDMSDRAEDPGWCYQRDGDSFKTKFRIKYPAGEDYVPYCADVIVTKFVDDGAVTGTRILSYGYNTCDDDNPRRIERGLEFNY